MTYDPPYLDRLFLKEEVDQDTGEFPFNLSFVRNLDIRFDSAVTFFIGENGSGKSTLMEAIAQICRLPVGGGSRNEIAGSNSPHLSSPRILIFFRARTKVATAL
jgi:predicted ATPase